MVYWDRKHEIAVKELDAISWSAKKAGGVLRHLRIWHEAGAVHGGHGGFLRGTAAPEERRMGAAAAPRAGEEKQENGYDRRTGYMKYKKVKARLMALSAAILVALSTNTGVRAASTERPSFSDVTQSQSYYADIESLAEKGWLS